MKLKKIIIAVSLDEATQKPFQYLKEMPIPKDAEIVLVNMVTETYFASDSAFALIKYPLKEDRPKIEGEVNKKLTALKNEIFHGHTGVTTKVIFDMNIKAAFTDYVASQKADLVVVATRGRRGLETLFDSSFAQHQLKYSPVNVLVLR